MPDSSEFTLEADSVGVIRRIGTAMPGGTALRAGVVVVVVEITSSMIEPASDRIDQSCRVKRTDGVSDMELGVVAVVVDLAPALVVDHPSDNTGVVLELLHHDAELALKLGLLNGCGKVIRLTSCWAHGGHVLDDEKAEFVAGMVVELGLDFDLVEGVSVYSKLCRGTEGTKTYMLPNHIHPQTFD